MVSNDALFRRLAEARGVPGREEQVRDLVRAELAGLVDTVTTDALGNAIGTRHGRDEVRVLIAAHMDEIGFLVRHIDARGFLWLQNVGYASPETLAAQRVLVTTDSGATLRGALQRAQGWMHPSTGRVPTLPTLEEFYVDLGRPAAEVHAAVRVGDFVTMDRTFERLGNTYLSKAIDDRVGLFVMLEALRAVPRCAATVYAVATVQEEVGLRGATVAGYALNPTVAIAVDDTPAMDVPGSRQEHEYITRLGGGVAIKLLDGSLLCDPGLVRQFRAIAEREGIPHQLEVLPAGGTDAGALQRARGGVPAITLSIPARYVHTPNEMCSATDVQAAIDLLAAFLREC